MPAQQRHPERLEVRLVDAVMLHHRRFAFLPQHHELFGIGIRQRLEHDPVQDREDRRARADPEAERHDRREGEPGTPHQHARAETEILKQCVHRSSRCAEVGLKPG